VTLSVLARQCSLNCAGQAEECVLAGGIVQHARKVESLRINELLFIFHQTWSGPERAESGPRRKAIFAEILRIVWLVGRGNADRYCAGSEWIGPIIAGSGIVISGGLSISAAARDRHVRTTRSPNRR
jgi:hypothetical protein